MESVFKSMLGIFFLLVLSFAGVGLVEASIDSRSADSYLSRTVALIESSHYSNDFIKQRENDAKEKGYRLSVELYENELGECTGSASLKYKYNVSLLGLSQERTIRAEIR